MNMYPENLVWQYYPFAQHIVWRCILKSGNHQVEKPIPFEKCWQCPLSSVVFYQSTHGQRWLTHRRSQGGPKGPCPPKFFDDVVIFCFERSFSKQNSVIRQKSNILAAPQFFGPPKFLGWLRHWVDLPTTSPESMHMLTI